jgi:hypothetical protein
MKQGYNQKYGRSIPVIPSIFAIPSPANQVGFGTASSVLTDYLVDANADFVRQGVQLGATVYNLATGDAAVVTTLTSTQVELTDDIFTGVGQPYAIGNTVSGLGCAIWTGTGGNIAGTTIEGDAISLTNVPAGVILPIIFKIVDTSGTTATNMVALFE